MGTRNLTMVIANGETKVAQYGQWDGYPSGVGAGVLKFCQNADLSLFKEQLKSINWLTDKQGEQVDKMPNWSEVYPYLSRDAAEKVLNAIHSGIMEVKRQNVQVDIIGLVNNEEFAADSLFCEWAYVIDLDKNTLEVFKGFNRTPLEETERFYHLTKLEDGDYYPVKLIKEYSLSTLPNEEQFLKDFSQDEED